MSDSSSSGSSDSSNSSLLNKDIALRALLFAMVFYILSSPVIAIYINKYSPIKVEVQLINAILFALIFYVISVNI
jgi:hypothetical protein